MTKIEIDSATFTGKRVWLEYSVINDTDTVVGAVVAAEKPKSSNTADGWFEPLRDHQLSGIFRHGKKVVLSINDNGIVEAVEAVAPA